MLCQSSIERDNFYILTPNITDISACFNPGFIKIYKSIISVLFLQCMYAVYNNADNAIHFFVCMLLVNNTINVRFHVCYRHVRLNR